MSTPAFMQLQLLSSFDEDERKPALLIELTLAHEERLAQLPVGAPVNLDFGLGPASPFILLQAVPAPDAECTSMVVKLLDKAATESTSWASSMSFEVENGSQLARDIAQLLDLMELRGTTQEVALASADRLTTN